MSKDYSRAQARRAVSARPRGHWGPFLGLCHQFDSASVFYVGDLRSQITKGRRKLTTLRNSNAIYHFHITDGPKLVDPRGLELSDAQAAIRYAEGLAHSFRPVS